MKNSKCFLALLLRYYICYYIYYICIIVLYDFNFIGKIRRFINRRICVHSLFFRFYFYFSKIKENRIDRIILIQFIENNSAIIHWQIIKKYTIEILILNIKVYFAFHFQFFIFQEERYSNWLYSYVIWYCRISSSTNMIPLKIQRYRNARLHARF